MLPGDERCFSSPEEITNRRWGPTTGAVVFHLTLLVYVAKLVTSSFTATFLSEFEWLGECRVPLPTSRTNSTRHFETSNVYSLQNVEVRDRQTVIISILHTKYSLVQDTLERSKGERYCFPAIIKGPNLL